MSGYQDPKSKEIYSLDYPDDYGKEMLAMGYQDTRDKKDEILGEWKKRAPMGFQGMRGKKTILNAIEELEKRAIMGFHVSKRSLLDLRFHNERIIRITNDNRSYRLSENVLSFVNSNETNI